MRSNGELGSLGPEDLIARVHEEGRVAGVARRGLANAWRGQISRHRRVRRRGYVEKEEIPFVEDFLRRLEEMLRNQAGIHVRLPSHIARPFNSLDLYAEGFRSVNATVTTAYATDWTMGFPSQGQLTLPEGWRGEVTKVSSLVMPFSATRMQDAGANMRWRLIKNGGVLAPYSDLRFTGSGFGGDLGGTVAPVTSMSVGSRTQMTISGIDVGIHLVENDQLRMESQVFIAIATATVTNIDTFGSGWMYPIRADARDIRGTIQD